MLEKSVSVQRSIAAPVEAVWLLMRDFCGSWHPTLEWVKAERDAQGNLFRRFKVKGEERVYRERLTYLSDWDRTLRYEHIEGIRDVSFYRAECRITPAEHRCMVEWNAYFAAPEERAAEIGEGTRLIFEAGIAALEKAAALKDVLVPGKPALAITHTAERQGPLCLFLHGIGGNRGNWQEQLVSASQHCQAAALDLRGYGGSALGGRQSSIGDHCVDILRILKFFKKDRLVLCGLSFGSWIAASFAIRYPELLSGLVLSGGCTGMSEATPAERQAFLMAREEPLKEGKSPADFAPGVVNIIAGPRASSAARQALLEAMAAVSPRTYRDALHCFTRPEDKLDFSRINCPVLLMTGEHDRLASPAEIRAVANRIHKAAPAANVHFEVIEDAGHVCNIENPRRYNELLGEFLQGIKP